MVAEVGLKLFFGVHASNVAMAAAPNTTSADGSGTCSEVAHAEVHPKSIITTSADFSFISPSPVETCYDNTSLVKKIIVHKNASDKIWLISVQNQDTAQTAASNSGSHAQGPAVFIEQLLRTSVAALPGPAPSPRPVLRHLPPSTGE